VNMGRRASLLVVLVGGCEPSQPSAPASKPIEPPSDPGPAIELARKTCGTAPTAIWRGHRSEPYDGVEISIEYGFEQLAFVFADGTELPVEPVGTLYFSDWRQEIFAPDCKHVVLLQDRFGPYHIVATEHLREYLSGRHPADHVVAGNSGCTSAAVHGDARWLDADTLEYGLAACGDAWDVRFELGSSVKPTR
jgi:hypothetical protein